MQKISMLCVILTLLCSKVRSQDYFGDLTSGATPVILKSSEKGLFSAVITSADNSVKTNFFRQYEIDYAQYKKNADKLPRHLQSLGWGINTKTKTEDGLGSLFGSGNFNPGFTGGAYMSLSRMYWCKNKKDKKDSLGIFGQWALILSGTLSTAKFQFYDGAKPYASQLSDTTFNGRTLSLSFVNGWYGGKDNIFAGASVSVSRLNNYGKLDKVNVKNDSIFPSGTGGTRIVQTINDDGDVYATGKYVQYNNFNIRANFSYVPGSLGQFVGIIFYPSVDLSKIYKPKYNLGLCIAHLKKGSPATSDAAFFLELNDLNNAAESTKPFFKRSFKFGVSTTLNIFSVR
jgi:hypothetical protein